MAMFRRVCVLLSATALLVACGGDDGGGAGADAAAAADGATPADAMGQIIEPGDPGAADVRLDVRTDTARRPISPLIYGYNGGGPDPTGDRPALVRVGGNRLTAYNWENNASNAGEDYCNQNDGLLGGPGTPPANAYAGALDDARSRGSAAVITVPIIDYVAADHDDLGDAGQGPPACVGDVLNSGSDYLTTRFVANEARKGGAFATDPDLNDGTVYQDEAVNYVYQNWGDVRVLVSLDNEPDLWSSTHPRVHPDPVSYDELATRTETFAAAVKDAWPQAETMGFVSYGFAGYMTLQNAPDAGANGPFIPYFLQRMKAAEMSHGGRIVDYLDLHWYTEAVGDGVRVSNVADSQGAAARMQAPRSLWDPTYREDSWIVNDYLDAPIRLVPWLQELIDANYPGTKLSLSEWNYGGGAHISGAIATADALGVFGREGVDAATIWFLRGDAQEVYTRAGLRVYRNYDGAGAGFGDTSVQALTSDVASVTVYAATGGGKVTIIAINKTGAAVTAGITVAATQSYSRVRQWQLDGSGPTISEAGTSDAVATNAFSVSLPAYSVSILVPE